MPTLDTFPEHMFLRKGENASDTTALHLDLNCETIVQVVERIPAPENDTVSYRELALDLFPRVATGGLETLVRGDRRVCRVCALGPMSAMILHADPEGPNEKVSFTAGEHLRTPIRRQLRRGQGAAKKANVLPSPRAQDRHRDLAATLGVSLVETGPLVGPVIVADIGLNAQWFVMTNYNHSVVPEGIDPIPEVVAAAWQLSIDNDGPPVPFVHDQTSEVETWWHVAALAYA